MQCQGDEALLGAVVQVGNYEPTALTYGADGAIWFTDPGYGALMDYEGGRTKESAASPQPFQKEAIYRLDASGKLAKVADQPFKPNGLCFSPDLTKLYVADTGASHYPEAKNIIWQFDVDGPRLKNPRTFANMEMGGKAGFADGIRADEDGNIWSSAGWVGDGYDGVHIFAPSGERHRPDPPARDLLERVLRRLEAQPAVHDRQPVALRGVRRDTRRAHHITGRLSRASSS